MKWENRIQVKKGNLGEKLVREYLHGKGYVVYEPVTDGPHHFNKIISKNKQTIAVAEVKCKAMRTYFPDTGFDLKHLHEYLQIKIEVFVFFVDESIGQIYGSKLSDMMQKIEVVFKGKKLCYPMESKGKIYFYQPNMKVIHHLTADEVERLRGFSTRRYEYPQ